MNYTGSNGAVYTTGQLLGKGGEGSVFEVVGNPGIVLKEYAPNKRSERKKRKLQTMINTKLPQEALSQITWPLDVVSQNGTFVGYTMPKATDGVDYNLAYAGKYALTLEKRLLMTMNLCAAIHSIHQVNQVCGDLNPKNIQVNPQTGMMKLIDTDSFHITDWNTQQIYRCEVGMGEYIAPEIQSKAKDGLDRANLPTFTKESDLFALAVHIFAMLMNGCHPFSCAVLSTQTKESVVCPSLVESISKGQFIFCGNSGQLTIPAYAPKFEYLPQSLRELFNRAFVGGHQNPQQRPTADEWYTALNEIYQGNPTKVYPQWANALQPKKVVPPTPPPPPKPNTDSELLKKVTKLQCYLALCMVTLLMGGLLGFSTYQNVISENTSLTNRYESLSKKNTTLSDENEVLADENETLNSFMDGIGSDFVIEVTDIYNANSEGIKIGDLVSSEMRYLYFNLTVHYLQDVSGTQTFYCSIYNLADGTLERATSSPTGYTFEHEFSGKNQGNTYTTNWGYGTSTRSTYTAGEYRVLIFDGDTVIGGQDFTIK